MTLTLATTIEMNAILAIASVAENDFDTNYKGDSRRLKGCVSRTRKMFAAQGFGPNVGQPILSMIADAARAKAGR